MPDRIDDSEMSRFDREGVRRFSARQAILSVAIVSFLLLLFSGGSVLKAADEEEPGATHDVLAAVGKPTNWVAASLPLQKTGNKLTASLSPDEELDPDASFDVVGTAAGGGGVPIVTPDYFDAAELGERPPPKQPLERLLVTGDSLSQPLDIELARSLTPDGVDVVRDAHVGTGISNEVLVDWGQLSESQTSKYDPQAVVVFIGANEGYPLPGPKGDIACCSADWATILANRARQMMANYRQNGKALVYWLTVPTPRDPARQRIQKVVNQAIEVAAQPWRSDVRIIDTVPVFTPDGKYSDSLQIDGRDQIVRESDGIHLNEVGSAKAADVLMDRLDQDFTR